MGKTENAVVVPSEADLTYIAIKEATTKDPDFFTRSEWKKNKEKYLTACKLRDMGFTNTAINKFLVPAGLLDNPNYKCAAPMKVYEKKLVDALMATQMWDAWISKSASRCAAAQKAAETRICNDIAEALEILDLKEPERIIFYTRNYDMVDEGYVFVAEDPANLDDYTRVRLAQNFIRHDCSRYEEIYNQNGFGNKRYERLREIIDQRVDEVLEKYDLSTGERLKETT